MIFFLVFAVDSIKILVFRKKVQKNGHFGLTFMILVNNTALIHDFGYKMLHFLQNPFVLHFFRQHKNFEGAGSKN